VTPFDGAIKSNIFTNIDEKFQKKMKKTKIQKF